VTDRSDQQLAVASMKGDRGAYTELASRHLRRIFAVCLGILSNVSDAEDASQDTLLRGFTKIHTLRDSAQFEGWINQIARNICRDMLRKRLVRQRAVIEQPASESAPEDERTLMLEAINKLPEKYRLPLMLYYFNGHDSNSVARVLNLSRAGACTRLSRARRELRELLENRRCD
jgi:RNA polymerase sigma-70 factor (ECF subfamily)